MAEGDEDRTGNAGRRRVHKLGRYELRERLGEGGMGIVYRAYDPDLERYVAIKIIPRRLTAEASVLTRFKREARSMAALNHPNIATIYGLETDGKRWYIVMEYVDGDSLTSRASAGSCDVPGALDIVRQVADAMAYAHRQGVIHRDIKPANILLDAEGKPKVVDFGLAKTLDESQTALTRDGASVGTPAYMSPEQANGVADVDARTDIYSLGVVLYELVAGRRPFAGGNPLSIMMKIVQGAADPIERVNPNVPADVTAVVKRAMACRRADRYGTMEEFSEALGRLNVDAAAAGRAELQTVTQIVPLPSPRPQDTDLPGLDEVTRQSADPPAIEHAASAPERDLARSKDWALSRTQQPQSKRRPWLPWALGGAGALVLLLAGIVVLAGGDAPANSESNDTEPAATVNDAGARGRRGAGRSANRVPRVRTDTPTTAQQVDAVPGVRFARTDWLLPGFAVRDLTVADFDGDGHKDVATLAHKQPYVDLALGGPGARLKSLRRFPAPEYKTQIDSGDWDGDGRPELVVACPQDSTLLLIDPDIEGEGATRRIEVSGQVWGVACVDFNADGTDEVAYALWNRDDDIHGVTVLPSQGEGRFGVPVFINTPEPCYLCAEDLDGDGREELCAGLPVTGQTGIIPSSGDRSQVRLLPGPMEAKFMTIGDFNGDGHKDLAVGTLTVNKDGVVWVSTGKGSLEFDMPYVLGALAHGARVETGDVDGDGVDDLLTCDRERNLVLFKGRRGGRLQEPLKIHQGVGAGAVHLADMNGDGRLDVICGDETEIETPEGTRYPLTILLNLPE